MPEMDGLEVCRRVRARKPLEAVRLIAMTGQRRPELDEQSLKAGAVACLAKPVEVETLLEVFRVPLALGKKATG